MKSLRLRLFLFFVALAGVVALAVGSATYSSVRQETDALFDYHLRQTALSLRDQGPIDEGERAAQASAEFDYLVQVWSIDGVALYSTLPSPRLLPRAVLGFSTVDMNGAPWRVYSSANPRRIVQVAQPLAVRRARASEAAWRSVLPIGLAAPFVALAMWWVVGASLAPLARVAALVRERDAGALAPLPTDELPSEVTPLVTSFNTLLVRLEAAFETQQAFVADAAHELRTPLTALKLQLGLLRGAENEAEREDAIARLHAGIERARRLVEQLLALARAEPTAATPRQALDLTDVARRTVADCQPLAQAAAARITLEAPAPVTLPGDADALRSLMRNLIENALKYGSHPGGDAPQVRVSVTREDGAACLRVDDAGPGIPPDERARVFDRFHRRAPGQGSGSGLGLAIVQAIARQHGGRVALGDSPAGGLRVEVLLPVPP